MVQKAYSKTLPNIHLQRGCESTYHTLPLDRTEKTDTQWNLPDVRRRYINIHAAAIIRLKHQRFGGQLKTLVDEMNRLKEDVHLFCNICQQ